LKENVI